MCTVSHILYRSRDQTQEFTLGQLILFLYFIMNCNVLSVFTLLLPYTLNMCGFFSYFNLYLALNLDIGTNLILFTPSSMSFIPIYNLYKHAILGQTFISELVDNFNKI